MMLVVGATLGQGSSAGHWFQISCWVVQHSARPTFLSAVTSVVHATWVLLFVMMAGLVHIISLRPAMRKQTCHSGLGSDVWVEAMPAVTRRGPAVSLKQPVNIGGRFQGRSGDGHHCERSQYYTAVGGRPDGRPALTKEIVQVQVQVQVCFTSVGGQVQPLGAVRVPSGCTMIWPATARRPATTIVRWPLTA
jgi:hypothetical protein